jgi:hypothetical protein
MAMILRSRNGKGKKQWQVFSLIWMIDREGIIRAADVNADYTIGPEPSETFRAVTHLIT